MFSDGSTLGADGCLLDCGAHGAGMLVPLGDGKLSISGLPSSTCAMISSSIFNAFACSLPSMFFVPFSVQVILFG